MAAIVASTLARTKSDPLACLGGTGRVSDFFARAGHAWRRCAPGPADTLKLFVPQALNGNAAMADLRHLAGFDLCPSSYCDARARLPVAAVRHAVRRYLSPSAGHRSGGRRR